MASITTVHTKFWVGKLLREMNQQWKQQAHTQSIALGSKCYFMCVFRFEFNEFFKKKKKYIFNYVSTWNKHFSRI